MRIKPHKIHKKQIIIDEEPTVEAKNTDTKNSSIIKIPIVIILVTILSLISGCLGAYLVITSMPNTTTTSNGITTSTTKLNETNSIANAVEKVYDSVVVVEAYKDEKLVSTGTGFVYKKENGKAYLMTNNHVISAGTKIEVIFTDETKQEATIVGSDTYSDIAVLSVKDSDKIVASIMGDSSKSKVGDTVFTVGSPEGSDYAGTVTKGIISAQERLIEVALNNSETSDYYMEVLQTDAAINPGNSGGPICNINGEVIGITNLKLVSEKVEGMGFAIPIEEALKVSDILEKNGKITRPYIGISMLDLSNSFYLWQAGILIPNGIKEGIAIYKVEKDSPAEKAGLQKGDIITKIANKSTKNLAEFRYELYKHNPNDVIQITYYRNGNEQKTNITLSE